MASDPEANEKFSRYPVQTPFAASKRAAVLVAASQAG
jgi:hypothetical protein